MKKEEGYFSVTDDSDLFYRSWLAEQEKAVLLLMHGLGEHSGRYGDFAKYFTTHGYSLYILDLRGHGKSPGKRAHIDNLDIFIQDWHEFILTLQDKQPQTKFFLIGHSFGGQLAINYLSQYSKGLCGAVLSSPNIEFKIPISLFKQFLGNLLSHFIPSVSMSNDIDPKFICRDRQVVLDYKRDTLVNKSITLKLGFEIINNLKIIYTMAPKIKVPMLMLHAGDDQITSKEASRNFFNKLKVKDRQIKIYPGMYHEIFNEINKKEVFADLKQWLDNRI